jgi:hypothetical protein
MSRGSLYLLIDHLYTVDVTPLPSTSVNEYLDANCSSEQRRMSLVEMVGERMGESGRDSGRDERDSRSSGRDNETMSPHGLI